MKNLTHSADDHTAIIGSETFLDGGLTDAECDGTQPPSQARIDALNEKTEERLKQKNNLDK